MTISDYAIDVSSDGDASMLARLEQLGDNLFLSRFGAVGQHDHLFGGQVVMQALAAASTTVEGRACHSLHGYFLRAGSAARRIFFTVERMRDGGRFATRQVTAEQDGRAIFRMTCSFHSGEHGFDHQAAMPRGVAPPDTLPDLATFAASLEQDARAQLSNVVDHGLIDMRIIDPERFFESARPARRKLWLRVPSAANSDDPLVHQHLLAYLSDHWLAGVALMPHPARFGSSNLVVASLDHAIWFHRPCRADAWLLYDCDSPNAGNGRGLSRGLLYDEAGALVASVAQETLLRPK